MTEVEWDKRREVANLYMMDTMLAAGGEISGRPESLFDLHGIGIQSFDCGDRNQYAYLCGTDYSAEIIVHASE